MEEQEENKKVTLLDQLSIAVSSPKNYKQLVKNARRDHGQERRQEKEKEIVLNKIQQIPYLK